MTTNQALTDYPIKELKLIYQILQGNLQLHMELMDSDLLHDMQTLLQQQATADGVDVSLHAQWLAWLNDQPLLPDEDHPGDVGA